MAQRKKSKSRSRKRKNTKRTVQNGKGHLHYTKRFLISLTIIFFVMIYWRNKGELYGYRSPAMVLKDDIINNQKRKIESLQRQLQRCSYEKESGEKAKTINTSNQR